MTTRRHPETPERGTAEWFADRFAGLHTDPDYIAEGLAIHIVEQVLARMEVQDVNRTQLAERMEVTRSYVTKLLNAPPNMTLKSVAQLALAVGAEPKIWLTPAAVPAEESAPLEEAQGFFRAVRNLIVASATFPIVAARGRALSQITINGPSSPTTTANSDYAKTAVSSARSQIPDAPLGRDEFCTAA